MLRQMYLALQVCRFTNEISEFLHRQDPGAESQIQNAVDTYIQEITRFLGPGFVNAETMEQAAELGSKYTVAANPELQGYRKWRT